MSVAPTTALARGRVSAGLRTSYLLQPVGGSQPSPTPTGTATAVVKHLFLAEALASVGVTAGLDVGLAVPLHVYQTGIGLTGIGIGDELAQTALGDPRLTFGYQFALPFALRSYATGYLPLGDPTNFAGERSFRVELGTAAAWQLGDVELEADLALRLRETSTLTLTTWGPQLRLGLAAAYSLTEELFLTAECTLAPTLTAQPPSPDPPSGYLLPAEVLSSLRYQSGSWTVAGLAGTGLPLSIPAGQSPGAGLRRGPTSPLLRLALEARHAF